ncbi:hypothetical protein [Noviherbaspirillum sp. UKPF54]|uniref:hypothetical protein n=1 Tax=Noviherbaspirillum sp. UKPF54 TaxID=2601898 RepID=UPI001FEF8621|nr:hypothetical protein [Noviherbaspirillum sp. UKPF54]
MPYSIQNLRRRALAAAGALLLAVPAFAQASKPQPAAQGPDLDLAIRYYTRVLTAEGVLRESRYDETMLRRRDHVWVARVLPKEVAHDHGDDHAHEDRGAAAQQASARTHEHKHFNYAVLSRHVVREGGQPRLEFVDAREREVVAIAPADYDNVNFDGSWTNAFFLLDPQSVAALPLSNRPSPAPGARWRERERNGVFQRVLWDERKMIPLVVESGDRQGRFFQRIEVKPRAALATVLPWKGLQGYAQKEYADFLD